MSALDRLEAALCEWMSMREDFALYVAQLESDLAVANAENARSLFASVRAEAARLEAEYLCGELLRLYDTAAAPPDAWAKGGEKRAKVEAWRRGWANK